MNTTEHASAVADAESAARNRPNDFAAYEALGSAYFEAERLDEAMRAFQRAVELNPGAARAYDGIGHIHYKRGEAQAAITAYEQGIASDPHYVYNYFGLGILYSTRLGDYAKARAAFERGLAANPGNSFLTANLGCNYARMGEIQRGLHILEEVVEGDPQNAFALSWLALLYLHLMRLEDAAAACRSENEADENAASHRLLGYIAQAQGRKEAAVAELERAIELDPGDYEARGALAKAYRAVGDRAAGEQHYRAGLAMAQQDDEYGQACFHAVSGEVGRALDLLESVAAKGQTQTGWMHIDPEFAFIQDEPRFRALLDKGRAAS